MAFFAMAEEALKAKTAANEVRDCSHHCRNRLLKPSWCLSIMPLPASQDLSRDAAAVREELEEKRLALHQGGTGHQPSLMNHPAPEGCLALLKGCLGRDDSQPANQWLHTFEHQNTHAHHSGSSRWQNCDAMDRACVQEMPQSTLPDSRSSRCVVKPQAFAYANAGAQKGAGNVGGFSLSEGSDGSLAEGQA